MFIATSLLLLVLWTPPGYTFFMSRFDESIWSLGAGYTLPVVVFAVGALVRYVGSVGAAMRV